MPPVADAVNVTAVPTDPVDGPVTVTLSGVPAPITIVAVLKAFTLLVSVPVALTV